MAIEPGTTLGRYQILGELGHGGMASVYKAFQPALERTVALKVLRAAYANDPEFLERFRREALAIARLRHPHIVQVHDFDAVGELVFLVMEHIEGGTLKQKLRDERALPWAEIGRIVREVAEALAHAHAQGIVHRDVKPSNVMLTKDGRAVVTDFGIAKILAASKQTETGVGIGTPEYMSPEQGQSGTVDHRSDIYSLGVLAYEALTGRVPFSADTPLGVMLAHVREPLPLPSKVNARIGSRIEQVLLRSLAKDPAARYPTATAFAEALEAAIAADAQGNTAATRPAPAPRAAARAAGDPRPLLTGVPRPVLAAIGAAGFLLVAGAGAGVAALMGGGRGTPADGAVAASVSLATGTNVTATLAAVAGHKPATITFGVVSSPGEITVRPVASGPLLPLGVTLATGAYYEINTTAKFDKATLCFEDANVTPRSRLLHYTANTWNDRTTSTMPPRICGEFTSFSPVAIVEISVGIASQTRPTEAPAATTVVPPSSTVPAASVAPIAPATSAPPPTAAPAIPTLPAVQTAAATAQVAATPTLPPAPTATLSTIDPSAPKRTVSGRLTSAATGAPMGDVGVHFFDTSGGFQLQLRTDGTGRYSGQVPSGTYLLQFYPDPRTGHAVQWWGGASSTRNARRLELTGDTTVDAPLSTGFGVSGAVTRGGTGVGSAIVNLYDGPYMVGGTMADQVGSFTFRLLSGTYEVRVYQRPNQPTPDLTRAFSVSGSDVTLQLQIP